MTDFGDPTGPAPASAAIMLDAAKNKHRAPIHPLNASTLALTTGGLGFLRPAPGSWGSLPPVALAFILLLAGASPVVLNVTLALILIGSSILCVALGRYAEQRFGRKDAGEVVVDETAAQSLTLLFLPASLFDASSLSVNAPWAAILTAGAACSAGFFFFRVADIVKPWPARALERLPHGWGVLADDLIAGMYAMLMLQALVRVLL